jgi:hypothetical protein
MTNVNGTARLSGSEAAAHCENDSFERLWTPLPDLESSGIYRGDVQPHLSQLIGLQSLGLPVRPESADIRYVRVSENRRLLAQRWGLGIASTV